ncbi:lamin tail domain-containing protein [Myxococcota bacterium]|nr:lamin tail domain-containing protein [Myxococcota bacterium]
MLGLLLAACLGQEPPSATPATRRPALADAAAATAAVGAPPALCINELMPANRAALLGEDGSAPDWIELFNPTEADLSLSGWTISDDREALDRHALSGDLVVPAGGALLLYADEATEAGPAHLPFKLSEDGEEVALFDPEGDATVLVFGKVYDDFAVARATDCCTGEGCLQHVFRGSPGVANTPVETTAELLVAAGSTWAYRDDGSAPGADWTTLAHDDSAWSRGGAPLGYGDTVTTTVSYGANPDDKHVTTWFRHSFRVTGADALLGLDLGLRRDDGAVVWLNGAEVVRSNMPEGAVDAGTLATASVGDGDETAYFSWSLDPAALVEGDNILAVEIHQAAVNSSDIGFDLYLEASRRVD